MAGLASRKCHGESFPHVLLNAEAFFFPGIVCKCILRIDRQVFFLGSLYDQFSFVSICIKVPDAD